MSPANRIAPPLLFATEEPVRPITAALDADWDFDWDFADEPAATDRGLMGKPDAALAEFPPGPSDVEIAALIDECTEALCRPTRRRRPR